MLTSNTTTEKKKGRRARFQERTADEEAEAQKKARYDENLKAKSGLIMAEFEKHKKKMFLTASETLQENETKVFFSIFLLSNSLSFALKLTI